MAMLLPIGIISKEPQGKILGIASFRDIFGHFLFVNPEKLSLRRIAKIAQIRTMGGTVFQPWPNEPDVLEFNGTLFGSRSLIDIKILDSSIPMNPDYKEVELVYKWKKYKGFVKDLSIDADADKPRAFNYKFSFVSTEALELHRMWIGQLTGLETEKSFLEGQTQSLTDATKQEQLNVFVSSLGAATGGMGVKAIGSYLARKALIVGMMKSIKLIGRKIIS